MDEHIIKCISGFLQNNKILVRNVYLHPSLQGGEGKYSHNKKLWRSRLKGSDT